MTRALVLLRRDVGVNLLVVPAGIFFLSFSKRYIVGHTANSSVGPGILLGHFEWNAYWPDRNAACPIKLDMSRPNVLLGFLHGISRIPSWLRRNATRSNKGKCENEGLHLT
jgi:hypothetical protein